MVCEQCGKALTTKPTGFDGTDVQYTCVPYEGVGGSVGCGYEGSNNPLNGNAKLPWKVEWPAKWKAKGVHIEGGGKDHSTKGGARDVANHIAQEVFNYEPPFDLPYEFFLIGGKKMSSSKGQGSSAVEVSHLVPTSIFRLALLGTQPKRAIDLDPGGETIPTWFDWYDKIAEKHWSGEEDDDARLFVRVHQGNPPERMYLPRFSTVAFIVQMEHLNLTNEITALKGSDLTEIERTLLQERAAYARLWIAEQAPEKYRFVLQKDTIPERARALNELQKKALAQLVQYIESTETLDGAILHEKIHEIKAATGITPKEFFSAIYLAFLGRESGPQAGWFLATLDRAFVIERLQTLIV